MAEAATGPDDDEAWAFPEDTKRNWSNSSDEWALGVGAVVGKQGLCVRHRDNSLTAAAADVGQWGPVLPNQMVVHAVLMLGQVINGAAAVVGKLGQ